MGISSTLNFHESIGTDRTQTHYISHQKQANLTAFELSWLLDCSYNISTISITYFLFRGALDKYNITP